LEVVLKLTIPLVDMGGCVKANDKDEPELFVMGVVIGCGLVLLISFSKICGKDEV
jgi:hypothetical protein